MSVHIGSSSSSSNSSNSSNVDVIQPVNNNDQVRWNGWGFADTAFAINDKGQVELTGKRYLFSGKVFPDMRRWAEESCGLDIDIATPSQVNNLHNH